MGREFSIPSRVVDHNLFYSIDNLELQLQSTVGDVKFLGLFSNLENPVKLFICEL